MRAQPTIKVLVLALTAAIPAQGRARLVADHNTVPGTNPGSSPQFSGRGIAQRARTEFAASEASVGQELWRFEPGTGAITLLRDIRPGIQGSAPDEFVEYQGRTFFVADDGLHGRELWSTDGTTGGTALVKDILPGVGQSGPTELTVFGTRLLFAANGPGTGRELWVSDGTEAGTVLLADIAPGVASSDPADLTLGRGVAIRVAFTATNGTYGREVWVTDGTPAGTVLLADVRPGAAGSSPARLAVGGPIGAYVAFRADDGVHGPEPWISNGASAGARLLRDIHPTAGSAPEAFTFLGAWYEPLRLLFTADDGATGAEPYVSDGVTTSQLADVHPGSPGSGAFGFIPTTGGRVVFAANDGTSGLEIWATDGTTANTTLVRDVWAGPIGCAVDGFLGAGSSATSRLYFSATDGISGREVWTTDGTPANTRRVVDLSPGAGSGVTGVTAIQPLRDGRLLVRGSRPGQADEPWLIDVDAATARIIADLNPSQSSSDPLLAVAVDPLHPDAVLLSWGDGSFGEELWRFDAATGVSTLVKDLNPFGVSAPDQLTAVGAVTYFVANDGSTGRELWRTDGTAAGTALVKDIRPGSFSSQVTEITPDRDRGLVFFVTTGTGLGDLWRSDGTSAGTFAITDTAVLAPQILGLVGEQLFFIGGSGSLGRELWVSDGTAAGTRMVKDIYPGLGSGMGAIRVDWWPRGQTPEQDGKLLFRATDRSNNEELWVSDGTAAGTGMLVDLAGGSSSPALLAASGGGWFFAATTPSEGRELWYTDGTTAGTRLVSDLVLGVGSSNPESFAGHDLGEVPERFAMAQDQAQLWFIASTPSTGREPWFSDGTAAGTRMLGDLSPGVYSSMPSAGSGISAWIARLPGSATALFAAHDGVHGFEVWRSDGTPAGTALHKDIAPGVRNGLPDRPVLAGSYWLFPAQDGASGAELWQVRAQAGALRYGRACDGSQGRRPRLVPVGAPSLGNGSFQLGVRNGLTASVGVMLIGGAAAQVSFGACSLYASPDITLPFPLDTTGAGTLALPIPGTVELIGSRAHTQAVILDPQGVPFGLTFTNGLAVLISSGTPNQFD